MGKQMKISEFEQLNSEQMNSSEVIEISQEENGILKSKRNPLSRLGNWINNTFNFNTLQTYNKNLVDGINEKREIRVGYYGGPAHNSVYRGKWLGTAPTEEQLDAIENGSFDDLYIGDFWSDSSDPTSDKIRWRIAGFNYFQNVGLDNEVLRNHAVIIPDTPVILGNNLSSYGGTQFYEDGGYKYSRMRGYEHTYESILHHKIAESGYILHLSHKPAHITNVYVSGLNIYDNNENENGTVWCSFPVVSSGEDPNNPGTGYVEFSTSNIQVIGESNELGREVTIPPSQWGPKTFESLNFYVFYSYYTGNGSLIDAKQIIFNKFGENHIMQHQTLLNCYELDDRNVPHVYNIIYVKEWTDVTVEIPTTAMIFGNSSHICYSEYGIDEYSYQLSYLQKPTYLSKPQYAPDQVRLPINIGVRGGTAKEPYKESGHIESYQLPLFLYDPALIHPGYGYWLRNCLGDGCQQTSGDLQWLRRHQYCSMNPYNSGPITTRTRGSSQEADLRPYFCLAKYNTPK